MLNKSKPYFKKKETNFLTQNNEARLNLIHRLFSRDMGLTKPLRFIVCTNTARLSELKLSKCRSIPSLGHSLTWFSLDNVENRL